MRTPAPWASCDRVTRFSSSSRDLVEERRLTTLAAERTTGKPAALSPSVGDDGYTMRFDGDVGRLVWMHRGDVFVGTIQARPA